MKVFKFGGASVKNAEAVRNVAEILRNYSEEPVAVVVSAMGKTTNALEKLTRAYFDQNGTAEALLEDLRKFHLDILNELFESDRHAVYTDVNNAFVEIEWVIEDEPVRSFDFEYDQMVSIGEMLSTKIVSHYLQSVGVANRWVDVRDFLRTDNSYRNAKVDWETTQNLIDRMLKPVFENPDQPNLTISQGFVGVTSENFTTTLGREGSDFSAAIIGHLLNAEEVAIWKDVPGVLNADPKYFDETVKLNHISYKEAIELAYYGASVIHPKTIKPLQNKGIPLWVRSFVEPSAAGTLIDHNTASDSLVPSFIFKMNQTLISIGSRDFSFIAENNLRDIFEVFNRFGITINTMQNSAISFSITVDGDHDRQGELIEALSADYSVRYNENLELVTIRHYDQATIERVTVKKKVLLEQRTRTTVRLLMLDEPQQG